MMALILISLTLKVPSHLRFFTATKSSHTNRNQIHVIRNFALKY